MENPVNADDGVLASPSLTEVFKLFFKIGALGFGGGPALISIIRQEVVEKKKWITDVTYIRGMTVSLMPPGSMMVNIAFFVGDLLHGPLGGVTALVAILLPSFIICIGLGVMLVSLKTLNLQANAVKGMAPAVVGVLLALVLRLSHENISKWWAALLMAVSTVLMIHFKVSPPTVIIGVVAVAAILWLSGAGRKILEDVKKTEEEIKKAEQEKPAEEGEPS